MMRPFTLPKALAFGILCLLSTTPVHAGTVTVTPWYVAPSLRDAGVLRCHATESQYSAHDQARCL